MSLCLCLHLDPRPLFSLPCHDLSPSPGSAPRPASAPGLKLLPSSLGASACPPMSCCGLHLARAGRMPSFPRSSQKPSTQPGCGVCLCTPTWHVGGPDFWVTRRHPRSCLRIPCPSVPGPWAPHPGVGGGRIQTIRCAPRGRCGVTGAGAAAPGLPTAWRRGRSLPRGDGLPGGAGGRALEAAAGLGETLMRAAGAR